MRQLARIVPTGLVISLLVGMAHGALIGMGAVYATSVGLRPAQVAVFMGAPMVGGVLFQLPIGALSDRVPRRGVMLVVALTATMAAVALLGAEPASLAAYGLMFVLGGASFPLYSLGIAHTNDWLEPHQVMGSASVLVMFKRDRGDHRTVPHNRPDRGVRDRAVLRGRSPSPTGRSSSI